jgi:tungstate transport system substrate-binding protein
MMKRVLFIAFFLFALPVTNLLADTQCNGEYGEGPNKFSLATGSPGELNLLKALAEAFSAKNKAVLCWVKAGSGESLKLLKDKQVDMIMVHAPDAEKKAVQDDWAVNRILIGSNEFYIVGPPEDPAKIAEATSANDAFSRIEKVGSTFFSRGDNSGTHQKEMSVWAKAQIKPEGNWYVVTKDFMKATLKKANDAKGYFMVDSSTWAAENKNLPNLKILFRGDKYLVNTYHTLSQPVSATPGAKIAAEFIEFVASKQGQEIIRNYGKDKLGEALYNDADYAKKYDD